jgi:hypothetical protein
MNSKQKQIKMTYFLEFKTLKKIQSINFQNEKTNCLILKTNKSAHLYFHDI